MSVYLNRLLLREIYVYEILIYDKKNNDIADRVERFLSYAAYTVEDISNQCVEDLRN